MKENNTIKIKKIIEKHNILEYKIIKYNENYKIFNTRNQVNIPNKAKNIICFLFPYLTKETLTDKERNISLYACGVDYHHILKEIFSSIISDFKKEFFQNEFYPFYDNSPFSEVKMALDSGLGVFGKNGLLINKTYGSYVFIGEIITDLDLIYEDVKDTKKNICQSCNKCIDKCPTKALSNRGLDVGKCLSFITQKKGVLKKEEKEYIKKSKIIWGCDICQLCCPHNIGVKYTELAEFKRDIVTKLSYDNYEKIYKERAFGFRGKDILKRNLNIMG